MELLPIKLCENLKLSNFKIQPAFITFNHLSIESEQYITICENSPDVNPQVIIIDLDNPKMPKKYPMSANSARMNPLVKGLLGLKSDTVMQIYNIDTKEKLNHFNSPDVIVFWKWMDHKNIGIITKSSAYLWNVENKDSSPKKIFERIKDMESHQIINFHADSDFKWFGLVGINKDNNRICGLVQLYSVDKSVSQPVEGHACMFTEVLIEGNKVPSKIVAFGVRNLDSAKLNIAETGEPEVGNVAFPKRSVVVHFPAEAASDFPLFMHAGKKPGIIFILTKMGYVYIYELITGNCFFANRISNEMVFASAGLMKDSGFICVNRQGIVLTVSINSDQIVPYLINNGMKDIAFAIAARSGYPGAEDAFMSKFNSFFEAKDFEAAARIAAKSTGNSIRNAQTIERFKTQRPTAGNQQAPIFMYFSTLLEFGRLNQLESLELCKLALLQGKKVLVEKWLKNDQLECSEALGDLAKSIDVNLATSIYLRASCHNKVIQCFAEAGQYDKILKYASTVGFTPDYSSILRAILYTNPDEGLKFALNLVTQDREGINIGEIAECFTSLNLNIQCTTFLLEALKENQPNHAELQTLLLELSLRYSPNVAEAIFSNKLITHFDRNKIAKCCENAGLVQRALEFYTDMFDIERAIVQTKSINPDWLVKYFGSLSVDDSLKCLRILIQHDRRRNIEIVVQVSARYEEQLGVRSLIALFDECKSVEGLFGFLNAIVWKSIDPDVHYRFVEAACKTNHTKELEMICKQSTYFDPEKVKNFLKEAKLNDQIPFIIICDRFNMVEDMVLHLHKNNLLRYVEIYVQKVNPSRLPEIVSALLEVHCSEEFLSRMLKSCPPVYDISKLVSIMSDRGCISLLQPAIQSMISEGSTEPSVHTALAIIHIEQRLHPEAILRENAFYDTLTVGRYCENRYPNLALIAYSRGSHDQEYLQVCVNNLRFKELAHHIISRKDPKLWEIALNPKNNWRRALIDHASQVALAEIFNPECISEMVKALMTADLPDELTLLLEMLVLEQSSYRHIKNLQNLLLLTAVKSKNSRLLDYINRLDNFDALQIAEFALSHDQLEEAFTIYKKFEAHAEAVRTLAQHIGNFVRATEYAERVNSPAAWSVLGSAFLASDKPKEAIEAFIRGDDYTHYTEVISVLSHHPLYDLVLKYLGNVRITVRDTAVDSEYAYCLAHTGQLSQLKELLEKSHSVSVVFTGDRLFEEGLYEAAKIFYAYADNYTKLVATHIKLNEFKLAVEMAKKANNRKMWKEVCLACLDSGEISCAQTCALSIVVHPDELESLVNSYEQRGHFNALLNLFEAAVSLERAHMVVFSELAILYAKYKPEKFRDYINSNWARLNIPNVLKAAEKYHLWSEVVFLYERNEQYDSAVFTMLLHPACSFLEQYFRDLISKVVTQDIYHKAITFYVEYQPKHLNNLLIAISPRLDHSRAISQLRDLGVLSLCQSYLSHNQHLNMADINHALNDIFIEQFAYEELQSSIEKYNNFDAGNLAQKLEKHECIELRRISAVIRKISNRWTQAIDIAKQDGLHEDAVLFAAESRDPVLARSLLDHFISINQHDQLITLLYLCYDLFEPDVVLETCWLGGVSDICMPFFIQYLSDCTSKLSSLESRTKQTENIVSEDLGQYSLPSFNSSLPRLTAAGQSSSSSSFTPVTQQPSRGSSNYNPINPFR